MMIGATPAKFTYSGCTTPNAMPAATPASIALPPASRIAKAGLGGEVLARGHHVARPHDGRAMGLHVVSSVRRTLHSLWSEASRGTLPQDFHRWQCLV